MYFLLCRGLDPLVFCGICGVVSAGIGYSIGTQLFKGFWRLMNKDKALKLLEVIDLLSVQLIYMYL